MSLCPGDIIAVRGSGWLSSGIASAEYPQGEPEQSATHVGLLVAGDPIPVVIEALNEVKTNPLSVTIASAKKAYALHDTSLTDAQRRAIIAKACTFSADNYGYIDLLAQWMNAKTGSTWWTDRLSGYLGRRPICSFVVAAAYHDGVGLDFGVDDASCRPCDILNFALSHPEIYGVETLGRR